jgi:hypothetical protein
MGSMKLDVSHALQLEDARARVTALLEYWAMKYGVKIAWAGDKATFDGTVMGITFKGHLTVQPGKVGGEASDPGMLLRGQAQKYLTKKFGTYLDPTKTLDAIKKAE